MWILAGLHGETQEEVKVEGLAWSAFQGKIMDCAVSTTGHGLLRLLLEKEGR
jgi:hypothetical protein